MDKLRGEELLHLAELLRLRSSVNSEFLRDFLDGIIRETYLRLKLLDVLALPELFSQAGEIKPLDAVVKTLEEMCSHYESHLREIRELRAQAKTPLELEIIGALEKSLERSHIAVRMLINALTEAKMAATS